MAKVITISEIKKIEVERNGKKYSIFVRLKPDENGECHDLSVVDICGHNIHPLHFQESKKVVIEVMGELLQQASCLLK